MLPDLPDQLARMLTVPKLTAIRDPLDSLPDGAGRRVLTIREAPTMLCARGIAREERAIVRRWSGHNGERRIEMSLRLAGFPFRRDLVGLDFAARPAIDRGQSRDLAIGRFIADGEAVLLPGPPASAGRIRPSSSVARPWSRAAPMIPTSPKGLSFIGSSLSSIKR